MKMTELLVSQDGASTTVLPGTTEEKARQIPDPVTFNLLCMVPKAKEEMESDSPLKLVKTTTMIQHEEILTTVLFVAKMGPDAYKDEKRFPTGPSCKVGDFVVVRPSTGTRMRIHGTEWRLISDDSVEAVVQDPRGIQRP